MCALYAFCFIQLPGAPNAIDSVLVWMLEQIKVIQPIRPIRSIRPGFFSQLVNQAENILYAKGVPVGFVFLTMLLPVPCRNCERSGGQRRRQKLVLRDHSNCIVGQGTQGCSSSVALSRIERPKIAGRSSRSRHRARHGVGYAVYVRDLPDLHFHAVDRDSCVRIGQFLRREPGNMLIGTAHPEMQACYQLATLTANVATGKWLITYRKVDRVCSWKTRLSFNRRLQ